MVGEGESGRSSSRLTLMATCLSAPGFLPTIQRLYDANSSKNISAGESQSCRASGWEPGRWFGLGLSIPFWHELLGQAESQGQAVYGSQKKPLAKLVTTVLAIGRGEKG